MIERGMDGVYRFRIVLRSPPERPTTASHGPRAHADRRQFHIAVAQTLSLHLSKVVEIIPEK
jgi:hypothetical protein